MPGETKPLSSIPFSLGNEEAQFHWLRTCHPGGTACQIVLGYSEMREEKAHTHYTLASAVTLVKYVP